MKFPIQSGRIFFSNDEVYLQGVQAGIEYANDGALNIVGVVPSTVSGYAWMLPVEDRDDDVIVGVYDDKPDYSYWEAA